MDRKSNDPAGISMARNSRKLQSRGGEKKIHGGYSTTADIITLYNPDSTASRRELHRFARVTFFSENPSTFRSLRSKFKSYTHEHDVVVYRLKVALEGNSATARAASDAIASVIILKSSRSRKGRFTFAKSTCRATR